MEADIRLIMLNQSTAHRPLTSLSPRVSNSVTHKNHDCHVISRWRGGNAGNRVSSASPGEAKFEINSASSRCEGLQQRQQRVRCFPTPYSADKPPGTLGNGHKHLIRVLIRTSPARSTPRISGAQVRVGCTLLMCSRSNAHYLQSSPACCTLDTYQSFCAGWLKD